MKTISMRPTALAVLSAVGLAAPAALAQRGFDSGQDYGFEEMRQQTPRQMGMGEDDQVIVGYDLDRDGRTDAWYYVSRQDYDRMMRENRQAMSGAQGQGARLFGQEEPWNEPSRRFGQQQTWDRDDWAWQQQQQQYQQRMRFDQQQDPWGQQPGDAFGGQMSQQHRGEITDLTTVRFPQDGKRHVIARVELDNGRRAVVHLGPEDHLQNVNIEAGERITFSGRPGQINNRPVILADRLEAGGETVYIQSSGVGQVQDFGQRQAYGQPQDFRQTQDFGQMQDFGQGQNFGQPQSLRQVRGQIQDVRTLRLDGAEQPHTLARVELDSGSTVVVDLGPQQDLRGLDLTRGDQIQALVRPATINNRPVLKAHELRANNETIRVRDTMGPQGMMDQQWPQQQQRRQQMQDQQWRGGY